MRIVRFAALAGVVGGLAGCAGTTPNLTSPQMQAPSLSAAGAGRSRPVADPGSGVRTVADAFLAPPYLQFGEETQPAAADSARLSLVWLAKADAKPADWVVETRPAEGGEWRKAGDPVATGYAPTGVPACVRMRTVLSGLEPGTLFDYRVSRSGEVVFGARARAPRAPGDSKSRFVVFGDTGSGTADERKVAHRISEAKPDYAMVAGDIVYSRGRASEYAKNFWPILNAETSAPTVGAPVLRAIPVAAAPGNHDIGPDNLTKYPDAYAYYVYWSQPLNGPDLPKAGAARIGGSETDKATFVKAAESRYPRMANFSVDYGTVHWTVLDSNPNVDWTDPALVAWLEKDLVAAKSAKWKFVLFHHPPFQSSEEHFDNQWMRVLAPKFEKHGVHMVWTGHVHNYQRSHPLRFAPAGAPEKSGRVGGEFTIDTRFDGVSRTKPDGVLYLVTGGGGAALYKKIADKSGRLQPFTAKLVNDTHSLTVVDIDDRKCVLRQLSADGKEIDSITVTQ
ncbi:MAG: metallophosphoesterase [Armatimonadota bacterium]